MTDEKPKKDLPTKEEIAKRFVEREKIPLCSQTLNSRIVAADPVQDVLKMEFRPDKKMCNANGVVQGGFVSAMLDDMFGPLSVFATWPGYTMSSLELKTSYLAAVKPDTLVLGEAWVVKMGRSVCFMEAKLTDENGKLLATASTSCLKQEFKANFRG